MSGSSRSFDEAGPAGAVEAFAAVRPRLFGIAYRMLGTVAEAEDVVQEAWLRWLHTDRAEIRVPEAFLVTATTRLAINASQAARHRRERYEGEWLPEPVETGDDPLLGAERNEALGLAVLLLLEKLSPDERAAFVLREAFDYPYERIAEILESSLANARQLVSRASRHLARERRVPVERQEQRRLLETFVAAARSGDTRALEELMAPDVVSTTDGGGRVRSAARYPVSGRDRVVRLVAGFAERFWTGTELQWLEANGQSWVRVLRQGDVVAMATLEASAEGIERLYWVMNPEKLRGLGCQAIADVSSRS